jgi:hypothetical protein
LCLDRDGFTIVIATVFALVAGGFLIPTRPIERTIARMVKEIWAMWTRSFHRSSKERIEEEFVIFAWIELRVGFR